MIRWQALVGLTLGLLLSLAASTTGPAKAQFGAAARTAMVIGNGDYENAPLFDLENPINDARAMNAVLREIDFEVMLAEDATRTDFSGLLGRIEREFPEGGVGLFYFAGHGVQYKGVNYLLPTDFALTTPEELPERSLPLNDVLQAMDRAGVQIGIVILDACRESPFGSVSDAFGQGLALVDAPGETLIAFATRPGGLAEDGFGANSPYTAALVSALEFPNQSIHEVFAAVRAKVSQATEGRQIPWILGSLGPAGTAFKFREVGDTAVATDDLSLPDGTISLASVQWKTIQDSVDPTDFERFLTMHAASPYTQLASRRLDELKREGLDRLPQVEIAVARPEDTVPGGLTSLVTECDVMAGDPLDDGRVTPGTPWGLVNTRIAIRACLRSVAEDPDNPRLVFNLGRALDIAERFDEAEELYAEAAALDYASAFKNLGYMHRTGRGRPQNMEEAARLYQEAALRGSLGGRTYVGALYREGWGVPQSFEEAMRWYRLAAQDGFPGALDSIGNLFLRGQGVDPNPAEAVRYYETAAMLGHPNAMHNLARAYLSGEGVDKDAGKAVEWFARATEEGNPYSPYYLGRMFRSGWGVETDHRLALTYFRLSADRGFSEAYLELAAMHEAGEGAERNLEEAYRLYWIARAAGRAHGNANSLKMADEADAKLRALRHELGEPIAQRAEGDAEEWLDQNGLLQFRLINDW